MTWNSKGPNTARTVFSAQMRETRERRGWSQGDLAKRVNNLTGGRWHQTTIAKIEQGERNVDITAALYIAAALDVSPLHLLVPRDDSAVLAVSAQHDDVPAPQARSWIRGAEPLPGMDDRRFRTEVPEPEWKAAQEPSVEERRAFERVERARHRVRVMERKLALVSDAPDDLTRSELLTSAVTGSASRMKEERLERAWTDVAEAEVDLEEAYDKYDAVRKAREPTEGK